MLLRVGTRTSEKNAIKGISYRLSKWGGNGGLVWLDWQIRTSKGRWVGDRKTNNHTAERQWCDSFARTSSDYQRNKLLSQVKTSVLSIYPCPLRSKASRELRRWRNRLTYSLCDLALFAPPRPCLERPLHWALPVWSLIGLQHPANSPSPLWSLSPSSHRTVLSLLPLNLGHMLMGSSQWIITWVMEGSLWADERLQKVPERACPSIDRAGWGLSPPAFISRSLSYITTNDTPCNLLLELLLSFSLMFI